MLADGFILWGIPAGRRLIKTSLRACKHINCPSLARGTSNAVAEGDGNHANLTDTACRVPTTSANISTVPLWQEERATQLRREIEMLEPR